MVTKATLDQGDTTVDVVSEKTLDDDTNKGTPEVVNTVTLGQVETTVDTRVDYMMSMVTLDDTTSKGTPW